MYQSVKRKLLLIMALAVFITSATNAAAAAPTDLPIATPSDATPAPEGEVDEETTEETVEVTVWQDGGSYTTQAPISELGTTTAFSPRRAAARATYPTYEQVYNALVALQSEFPEGREWTNYYPYGDNYTRDDGGIAKYYRFQGGLIRGRHAVGVGCGAQSFRFHDTLFAGLPIYVYEYGQFTWDDIHVGDFLRVDNDSHFVTVWKKTDSCIIVVEGNYNGSIHWGRAISRETIMSATTDYLVTSYPRDYSEEATAVTEVAKGIAGNLNWVLTSDGTLKINGSGTMPDFDLNETDKRPSWYDYRNQIYSVEIGEGVTSIGTNAFYSAESSYSSLISVILPNTLIKIGNNAFYGSNITGISIPANITHIGDDAFRNCDNLTSVSIAEGIKVIGERAFKGCTSLGYLDLPTTLTSLGGGAFADCSQLRQVRFMPSPNGTKLTTVGDDLFNQCWNLNYVSLPDGLAELPKGIFASCGVVYLYLPSSLTSLGDTVTDPFGGNYGSVGYIKFGGTEAQWSSMMDAISKIGSLSATTYRKLSAALVDFEQADPLVPKIDDPGDIVTCTLAGEHIGEEDSNGNCTACGKPYNQTPDSSDGDDNDESPDIPSSDTTPAPPSQDNQPGANVISGSSGNSSNLSNSDYNSSSTTVTDNVNAIEQVSPYKLGNFHTLENSKLRYLKPFETPHSESTAYQNSIATTENATNSVTPDDISNPADTTDSLSAPADNPVTPSDATTPDASDKMPKCLLGMPIIIGLVLLILIYGIIMFLRLKSSNDDLD